MANRGIDKSELLFDNRYLVKLIIPLLIETLLNVTIGMMDTIMVSTDGEAVVSGVSLVDSLANLFVFVFSAFATGGAVVCSQYLGRKDSDTLATFERNMAHLVADPADVLPERLYAFDTYQFADYSKYVAPCFDEAHKARHRDEQFPKDLQTAFEAGARMAQSLS